MENLSSKAIADAFALSQARGADLLISLAGAHVWQGNLSAMRDDDPRSEEADVVDRAPNEDVLDTLLLARALELLAEPCHSALATAYAKRYEISSHQIIRDGGSDDVTRKCEERLRDIAASLRASDTDEQVPKWVFARENGANGGHRAG